MASSQQHSAVLETTVQAPPRLTPRLPSADDELAAPAPKIASRLGGSPPLHLGVYPLSLSLLCAQEEVCLGGGAALTVVGFSAPLVVALVAPPVAAARRGRGEVCVGAWRVSARLLR
eukprot:CAMPEP_0180019026 /NCGR_PEP_ID=MMETSP0984-20121128/20846_1 /TAXON_ID=483367 /ORGANISM="non described non described, Strain CCMP 2436" /LENGTH=116 /DNA_ID=CAMNT_0021942451 /DNA_START=72 /DNA_END=419 /DNA_ORIENTATION=-